MANKFKLNIGDGLLSDVSRQEVINDFQIVNIPIEQIVPNEKNEFAIIDIEELKQSIYDVGLQQNIVLRPIGNQRYKILSGERRFRAISELKKEGKYKADTIPAYVKDLVDVNLDISDNAKELYLIATTNVESRKLSPTDCIAAMKMLDQVYDELRSKGENIGKRRDFMAERLGISPRSVQTLKTIDENLSDEFRNELGNNKLPLSVAKEIAKLPPEEQHELFEDVQGQGCAKEKDVLRFVDKKKKEHCVDEPTSISGSDFETVRRILNFSNINFEKATVTEAQFLRIESEKEKIIKAAGKIEKILLDAEKRKRR